MARSPLTRRQQDLLRAQIMRSAPKMVRVLIANVLGELHRPTVAADNLPDDVRTVPCELSLGKVRAAELLLNKALPTLQNAEIGNDVMQVSGSSEDKMDKLVRLVEDNPALQERLLRSPRVLEKVAEQMQLKALEQRRDLETLQ